MTHFSPEDIALVCGDDYLQSYPGRWEYSAEVEATFNYKAPSPERIKEYDVFRIDSEIFREIDTDEGYIATWKHLLDQRFDPLERELSRIFSEICRRRKVEAVLAWCNTPSLSHVAASHGLPVIHSELGALRLPHYIPTAYFDFSGVNGNTESERRYEAFRSDSAACSFPSLTREELLEFARLSPPHPGEGGCPTFAAGVAEQMELDSNTIAFSNGWNRRKLQRHVIDQFGKENVLTRRHPYQPRDPDEELEVKSDESASSIEFLGKCREVFSINSSVGLEALLYGKKATFVGQNPFGYAARIAIDDELELRRALNFAVFGYLVPYPLVYDHEYIRWRLSGPSETEILQHHFSYWLRRGSRRFTDLIRSKTDMIAKQAEWDEQRRQLEAACRHWSGQYQAVIKSRSWKAMAPARRLGRWARRVRDRMSGRNGRHVAEEIVADQGKTDPEASCGDDNRLLDQFDLISRLPGSSIMEFGCVNGRFLERAALRFDQVHGFDWAMSGHVQGVVREHENVRFEKRDVVREFPTTTADIAASSDFLEHLPPDDAKRIVSLLDHCAPINFHVIECYADVHGHQTVLPPNDWLKLFQGVSKDYYVLHNWRRDGIAKKRVCVVTNYPPPGADRREFIARAKSLAARGEHGAS
jgi:hypothetical protein